MAYGQFGFVAFRILVCSRRITHEALRLSEVVFFAPFALFFELPRSLGTAHAAIVFGHAVLDAPPGAAIVGDINPYYPTFSRIFPPSDRK